MKRRMGQDDGSMEAMSASSYLDADNDASHRDGHRNACHVNPQLCQRVDGQDDASHVNAQLCGQWDLFPPPLL